MPKFPKAQQGLIRQTSNPGAGRKVTRIGNRINVGLAKQDGTPALGVGVTSSGGGGGVGPPGPPGPQGATGPQGPAGGGSATNIEVNLSATATWRGRFTITDAAITGTSKVRCWQAAGAYTGKGTRADEAEMQPVSVIAVKEAAGSATVYWETPPMITSEPAPRMRALTTIIFSPADPGGVGRQVARRIGKVRGNVKFTYMVL